MQLTRRSFLAASAVLPAALRSVAQSGTGRPKWLFLGTDKGKGIYRAIWNTDTGEVGTPVLAALCDRPSYLAVHPKLPVLYAVQAVAGAGAALSSYRFSAASGELQLLTRVPSQGNGPCYVSVEREGRYAFVANYSAGSFAAFPLASNGEAEHATFSFHNDNKALPGPVKDRQDAAHLHCAAVSPDNGFVLACDLGSDSIFAFPAEAGDTRPSLRRHQAAEFEFPARPGSGPRHVAFHPNGRWMYCIHELDCTIDLYDWSVRGSVPSLVLREGSTISTLAAEASLAGNTGCEIAISPDGRFAYACSRGENSLAVYRVDSSSGFLAKQQHLACGGGVPRYFTFDPTRRWLLCANQGSSSVTVFAHDPATSRLQETPRTFHADTPMFLQFI